VLHRSFQKKNTVNFQTDIKGRVCIAGCDILPDGKLVFTEQEGKRLLMFSPFEVSYTGENIVAVTIWDKQEVVFVNVITNTIINTVDIGHHCYGTDFNMHSLAIRTSSPSMSHIVYLDTKGELIDRVNIPVGNSTRIAISLRDGTTKCTSWKANEIYCHTLTGKHIWVFRNENVLRKPMGIALDKNRNVYVTGYETNNVVVLSPEGQNCRQIVEGLNRPCSLRINIDRNELLACNEDGKAFVFSLNEM